MQRLAIDLGIDGDRGDALLAARADHARRDLAAIRDEDLADRGHAGRRHARHLLGHRADGGLEEARVHDGLQRQGCLDEAVLLPPRHLLLDVLRTQGT